MTAQPVPGFWQSVRAHLAALVNQFRLDPRGLSANYDSYPVRRTLGGVSVTPETAMRYSAVFACMRCIAETLAMLQWEVFERLADGTTRARSDHPVHYLLNQRPNPDVPALTFREAIVMQMLAWGNSYAQIEWLNNGQAGALWQIPSWLVTVARDTRGNLVYEVRGEYGAADRTLREGDVLHWRNVGVDGLLGVSTISQAAQTIGFGSELEQFGSAGFRNAPFLAGWLEYPGKLPDKEHSDKIKQSWREKYMGWRRAGEVPILESGMTYHQLQLPLRDAQFLESRQFQAQEICRWFRVPQHKINILEEASYANIESLEIDFFNETLLPTTVRLQQELDYKVFEGAVRASKFYAKHSLAPILKGDLKTRYEAYSIGLRYGFLSINDVRQMEDLDQITGGDLRTLQLNTVPLDEFEPLARVKLEQAEADLAYREAQTDALIERGETVPDASAGGSGGGGQDLFTPEQAQETPVDDTKAGTQARRRLQLLAAQQQTARGRVQPTARLDHSKNRGGNGFYNLIPRHGNPADGGGGAPTRGGRPN